MTAKAKYHTIVILDRSGSMGGVRDTTIKGVNEYLQTLNKSDGDMVLTFSTFSSEGIEYLYDKIAIADTKPLEASQYDPSGMTPLLDAIGTVVNKVEKQYADKKKKPIINVMIITDGLENCSKEHTTKTIKDLLEAKEKEGWGFNYLGANQDAWSAAGSIGIRKDAAVNYTTSEMVGTFKAVALNTSDARRAHSSAVRWSGEKLEIPDDQK